MLSAADLLAAIESHPAIDRGTLERGRAYAQRGRVSQLRQETIGSETVISAVVHGGTAYRTTVLAHHRGADVELSTACSCPMAYACKHVVAVLVALGNGSTARPDWRGVLDQVLESSLETPVPVGPPNQVAVQVVLPNRNRANRYPPATTGRPRPLVRVVRSGSTRRWVHGGVGWSELGRQDPGGAVRLDPLDLQLLVELKIALVGRRGHLLFSNEPLPVADAAPALWPALRRIVDHGIPLLCSDASVEVRLSEGAAEPQVDLAARDEDVVMTPGLVVDGTWFAPGDTLLVGDPVHGVLGWRETAGGPGTTVVLAPLAATLAAPVRSWFGGAGELTVSRSGVGELMEEYLPRLSGALTVISRDGSVVLPGEPEVRLHGDLTWGDDGRLDLTWRWDYRRTDGDQHVSRQQFRVDDTTERGWRRRRTEIDLLDRLDLGDELADLVSLGLYGPGTLTAELQLRDVEAMEFAREHLPWLTACPEVDLVTNGEPPEFRELTGQAQVSFSARGEAARKNRTDWLELEVIISFTDPQLGSVQLDLPRVLEALVSGRTRIMVHRGVYVDVDRPELDRLSRLVHDARTLTDQPRGDPLLRLPRQAHGLLAEVADFGPTEGQVRDWVSASAALRDLVERGEPLAGTELPTGLTATLRPYQHEGFQWLAFLRRHRLGGVLADDMGLGKTVQTLAMIARAREESGPDDAPPFLIVAPSSVVSIWLSEAARFTPGLRVLAVTESAGRRGSTVDADRLRGEVDVVVTSYTLFRLEADAYAAGSWAGLVLDEAQMVKNRQSKTHVALRRVDAECRFAITGTPIENNLMELWAILTLTSPGLFPHADQFRTEVAQPIEQDANPEVLAALRRRIRPVMLRRTKDLVAADLPPKQEQVLRVTLSPRHRKIYDTHLQRERQRILRLLDDLDENRITVLASLTRLRQLSLDPALVEPAYADVGSAKIDELLDRLTEISGEGHRALVFSQFTGFLTRVRERLTAAGLETVYLDGSTRRRPEVIDRFRSGTAPAFLISLKAGGVGLNLTEADYCFLLDPWWNPAAEHQAVDRTHRIGQTRPVMVYRLVATDTIEERVVELAARKADLYRSVLDADGELSSGLTASDIASLLS